MYDWFHFVSCTQENEVGPFVDKKPGFQANLTFFKLLPVSFLYFSIFPTQLSCHFNLKLVVCLVSCKVVECATQGALIDLAAVYGGSLEMKWNLNCYFCFNLKAGQLSKHQYYNFYSTSFVEKMVVISTKVVWPTLMSSLAACR